jgi:hypothetical protein
LRDRRVYWRNDSINFKVTDAQGETAISGTLSIACTGPAQQ